MEVKEILSKCDHTLLSQAATWEEIRGICDDGIKYGCASVCIPASFVQQAAEYVEGKVPVCTVIGFPNGYDTTGAKCFMAYDAVENGADEIDMVINLGWVKERKWDDLLDEIREVKGSCNGRILKVIIEQFVKPFHRCPFKDKGHEVVFLVIEQIGNVFAFCGGDGKTTCDFPADTDNVVILSVQLCGKPRSHSLGAGDQRGNRKRPLAGQFVHQTCPQHAGQRI